MDIPLPGETDLQLPAEAVKINISSPQDIPLPSPRNSQLLTKTKSEEPKFICISPPLPQNPVDDSNRYSPSRVTGDDDKDDQPDQETSQQHGSPFALGSLASKGTRTTVLGKAQAKKRLLAFSMTKQGGGQGLSFGFNKKATNKMNPGSLPFAGSSVDDETGDNKEKGERSPKKKGMNKKTISRDDKARAVVSAIEEIKREEMLMRGVLGYGSQIGAIGDPLSLMSASILPPAKPREELEMSNILSERQKGAIEELLGSLLTHDSEKKSKEEDKERRRSDEKRRKDSEKSGSHSKESHRSKERHSHSGRNREKEDKKHRTSDLPKNWQQFRDRGFKFEEIRRLKLKLEKDKLASSNRERNRKSRDREHRNRSHEKRHKSPNQTEENKPNESDYDIMAKPFESTSRLIYPFMAVGVRQLQKEYPRSLIRFTKFRPSIPYCESPTTSKAFYRTRDEILRKASQRIVDLMHCIINGDWCKNFTKNEKNYKAKQTSDNLSNSLAVLQVSYDETEVDENVSSSDDTSGIKKERQWFLPDKQLTWSQGDEVGIPTTADLEVNVKRERNEESDVEVYKKKRSSSADSSEEKESEVPSYLNSEREGELALSETGETKGSLRSSERTTVRSKWDSDYEEEKLPEEIQRSPVPIVQIKAEEKENWKEKINEVGLDDISSKPVGEDEMRSSKSGSGSENSESSSESSSASESDSEESSCKDKNESKDEESNNKQTFKSNMEIVDDNEKKAEKCIYPSEQDCSINGVNIEQGEGNNTDLKLASEYEEFMKAVSFDSSVIEEEPEIPSADIDENKINKHNSSSSPVKERQFTYSETAESDASHDKLDIEPAVDGEVKEIKQTNTFLEASNNLNLMTSSASEDELLPADKEDSQDPDIKKVNNTDSNNTESKRERDRRSSTSDSSSSSESSYESEDEEEEEEEEGEGRGGRDDDEEEEEEEDEKEGKEKRKSKSKKKIVKKRKKVVHNKKKKRKNSKRKRVESSTSSESDSSSNADSSSSSSSDDNKRRSKHKKKVKRRNKSSSSEGSEDESSSSASSDDHIKKKRKKKKARKFSKKKSSKRRKRSRKESDTSESEENKRSRHSKSSRHKLSKKSASKEHEQISDEEVTKEENPYNSSHRKDSDTQLERSKKYSKSKSGSHEMEGRSKKGSKKHKREYSSENDSLEEDEREKRSSSKKKESNSKKKGFNYNESETSDEAERKNVKKRRRERHSCTTSPVVNANKKRRRSPSTSPEHSPTPQRRNSTESKSICQHERSKGQTDSSRKLKHNSGSNKKSHNQKDLEASEDTVCSEESSFKRKERTNHLRNSDLANEWEVNSENEESTGSSSTGEDSDIENTFSQHPSSRRMHQEDISKQLLRSEDIKKEVLSEDEQNEPVSLEHLQNYVSDNDEEEKGQNVDCILQKSKDRSDYRKLSQLSSSELPNVNKMKESGNQYSFVRVKVEPLDDVECGIKIKPQENEFYRPDQSEESKLALSPNINIGSRKLYSSDSSHLSHSADKVMDRFGSDASEESFKDSFDGNFSGKLFRKQNFSNLSDENILSSCVNPETPQVVPKRGTNFSLDNIPILPHVNREVEKETLPNVTSMNDQSKRRSNIYPEKDRDQFSGSSPFSTIETKKQVISFKLPSPSKLQFAKPLINSPENIPGKKFESKSSCFSNDGTERVISSSSKTTVDPESGLSEGELQSKDFSQKRPSRWGMTTMPPKKKTIDDLYESLSSSMNETSLNFNKETENVISYDADVRENRVRGISCGETAAKKSGVLLNKVAVTGSGKEIKLNEMIENENLRNEGHDKNQRFNREESSRRDRSHCDSYIESQWHDNRTPQDKHSSAKEEKHVSEECGPLIDWENDFEHSKTVNDILPSEDIKLFDYSQKREGTKKNCRSHTQTEKGNFSQDESGSEWETREVSYEAHSSTIQSSGTSDLKNIVPQNRKETSLETKAHKIAEHLRDRSWDDRSWDSQDLESVKNDERSSRDEHPISGFDFRIDGQEKRKIEEAKLGKEGIDHVDGESDLVVASKEKQSYTDPENYELLFREKFDKGRTEEKISSVVQSISVVKPEKKLGTMIEDCVKTEKHFNQHRNDGRDARFSETRDIGDQQLINKQRKGRKMYDDRVKRDIQEKEPDENRVRKQKEKGRREIEDHQRRDSRSQSDYSEGERSSAREKEGRENESYDVKLNVDMRKENLERERSSARERRETRDRREDRRRDRDRERRNDRRERDRWEREKKERHREEKETSQRSRSPTEYLTRDRRDDRGEQERKRKSPNYWQNEWDRSKERECECTGNRIVQDVPLPIKNATRTPGTWPNERPGETEIERGCSPASSPLVGFKRSLADSTISDSELVSYRQEDATFHSQDMSPSSTAYPPGCNPSKRHERKQYLHSNKSPSSDRPPTPTESPVFSPKRPSLDDRIEKELGMQGTQLSSVPQYPLYQAQPQSQQPQSSLQPLQPQQAFTFAQYYANVPPPTQFEHRKFLTRPPPPYGQPVEEYIQPPLAYPPPSVKGVITRMPPPSLDAPTQKRRPPLLPTPNIRPMINWDSPEAFIGTQAPEAFIGTQASQSSRVVQVGNVLQVVPVDVSPPSAPAQGASQSLVLQEGNVLQVIPGETATSRGESPSVSSSSSQVVQIGNVLQVIPGQSSSRTSQAAAASSIQTFPLTSRKTVNVSPLHLPLVNVPPPSNQTSVFLPSPSTRSSSHALPAVGSLTHLPSHSISTCLPHTPPSSGPPVQTPPVPVPSIPGLSSTTPSQGGSIPKSPKLEISTSPAISSPLMPAQVTLTSPGVQVSTSVTSSPVPSIPSSGGNMVPLKSSVMSQNIIPTPVPAISYSPPASPFLVPPEGHPSVVPLGLTEGTPVLGTQADCPIPFLSSVELAQASQLEEAERRRAERVRRRAEKEKRRKEKEKRHQIKIKQATEMMKKALEQEGEMLASATDVDIEEMRLIEEAMQQVPDQEEELPQSEIDQHLKRRKRKLHGESLLPPAGKGILVSPGFREKPLGDSGNERKSVKFADGIRPGEGTSPSAGEDLPSPPPPPRKLPKEKRYKKKKKKIKVKIIRQINVEDDDDDDEDISPPPPPPGSPPPPPMYPPGAHYTQTYSPAFSYSTAQPFTVLPGVDSSTGGATGSTGNIFTPLYQHQHTTTTTHTTTVQFAPPPPVTPVPPPASNPLVFKREPKSNP